MDEPTPRVPVRDAATLILIDETGAEPKVLMGRRSMQLLFMPGKYVFPGGRIDAADRAAARNCALRPLHIERLRAGTGNRFTQHRAAALVVGAVRETFEETGLRIGRPEALVPVARAVTPAGMIRRYDTRFFAAAATEAVAERSFADRPDPELEALAWHPLEALERLDLAGITRHVVAELAPRLRDGSWRDAARPMPLFRTRRGRLICDWI